MGLACCATFHSRPGCLDRDSCVFICSIRDSSIFQPCGQGRFGAALHRLSCCNHLVMTQIMTFPCFTRAFGYVQNSCSTTTSKTQGVALYFPSACPTLCGPAPSSCLCLRGMFSELHAPALVLRFVRSLFGVPC